MTSLSIRGDGQQILTGSDDRTAKLWSRDGTLLQVMQTGDATVTRVAFAPDGETWAIADAEGQVSLWTGKDGPKQTISAHESWVLGLSFHPDGDRLATASRDGTVKLWERQTGVLLQTLPLKTVALPVWPSPPMGKP